MRNAPAPRGVRAVALVVAVFVGGWVTRDLWNAREPTLPRDEADTRFGLDEHERRAIFGEVVSDEPRARKDGHEHFADPWSAEDDRAAGERDKAREVAHAHAVNLTQVYLVLDEGIRAHWPGPDGKPIDATTVPLKPRPQ